ncbi:hypothetical protein COLO4_38420 [Corchorus olitorius]|uniref:Retrotransposon gag protein n=1 Tax=Corchorus olitorius TaxID=93759 RepID=A0A1R3FV69_9ROSI|nr:hypothetical protein COLO4_38420 [Corchorus olitorius]
MPEDNKLRLPVINFEKDTLHWHRNWVRYKGGRQILDWNELVLALEERFREELYDDVLTELWALQ